MLTKRAKFLLVLFAALACSVFAFSSEVHLSMADYESELDHLSAITANVSTDPQACRSEATQLPAQWIVSGQGQVFEVDTTFIVAELEGAGQNPSGDAPRKLTQRLAEMKADALAFDQPSQDVSPSRTKLNEILARREFRKVHGQTWLDKVGEWIVNIIIRILTRFFGSSSIPTIGKITVWSVLGIAMLALAWWIFKILKRNSGVETFMPGVMPISAKEWRKWLAEAQDAAAHGDWREAVHLSYWAGISFLEQQGMWRPDKARTPREYLRLLSSSDSNSNAYRDALSALTREFEVIWYGYKDASSEAYTETLAHLEALGCHLN